MQELNSRQAAGRRRANFFAATRLAEAGTAPDAAELEALAVVKTSIEAQALTQGRILDTAQLDRALSVAQRIIRALPRDQLHSIGGNSGLLQTITTQSLAVATSPDPRTAPQHRSAGDGHDPSHAAATPLGRRIADGADAARSSARFSGHLDREEYTQQQLRDIAEAQSAARHYGMANWFQQADLLKIGKDGVMALHQAGVQRETYRRMTSASVGISGATAADFAKWSLKHRLTPEQTNRLMNSTSELHESLTQDLPPEEKRHVQRQLDQSLDQFLKGPNTPEARRHLEEERMRYARTEEQREKVRANTKALEEAAQRNATAVQKDDATVEKVEAKVAAVDEFEKQLMAEAHSKEPTQSDPKGTPADTKQQSPPNRDAQVDDKPSKSGKVTTGQTTPPVPPKPPSAPKIGNA